MRTGRKLEIGGAPNPVRGYEQLGEGWGQAPLPFPDGTFDEVYSSHVIEHVPWWLTTSAIAEAYRVLKRGGALELHTVDFAYLVDRYLAGKTGDGWAARGLNAEMHPLRWVASRIFSVGETPADPNWHRAIFDASYLRELFVGAGFTAVARVAAPKGPSHGRINIGLRGVKP